jgi:hypothetical protein
LSHGFRKQPVVTDRTTEAADRRVGYRKKRLVVTRQIMRTGMNLIGYPGIHLAILVKNAFGSDQDCGIENVSGPPRVEFEH